MRISDWSSDVALPIFSRHDTSGTTDSEKYSAAYLWKHLASFIRTSWSFAMSSGKLSSVFFIASILLRNGAGAKFLIISAHTSFCHRQDLSSNAIPKNLNTERKTVV